MTRHDMVDEADSGANIAHPMPDVPISRLVEPPRIEVVPDEAQGATEEDGSVHDVAVSERRSADVLPDTGFDLHLGDAIRKLEVAGSTGIDENVDMVRRELVV